MEREEREERAVKSKEALVVVISAGERKLQGLTYWLFHGSACRIGRNQLDRKDLEWPLRKMWVGERGRKEGKRRDNDDDLELRDLRLPLDANGRSGECEGREKAGGRASYAVGSG